MVWFFFTQKLADFLHLVNVILKRRPKCFMSANIWCFNGVQLRSLLVFFLVEYYLTFVIALRFKSSRLWFTYVMKYASLIRIHSSVYFPTPQTQQYYRSTYIQIRWQFFAQQTCWTQLCNVWFNSEISGLLYLFYATLASMIIVGGLERII